MTNSLRGYLQLWLVDERLSRTQLPLGLAIETRMIAVRFRIEWKDGTSLTTCPGIQPSPLTVTRMIILCLPLPRFTAA
jgi:hypothetical protein